MKKLLIVALAAVAVALAGCQNTELEDCRAENAELRLTNEELEIHLGETVRLLDKMAEEVFEARLIIEQNNSNKN